MRNNVYAVQASNHLWKLSMGSSHLRTRYERKRSLGQSHLNGVGCLGHGDKLRRWAATTKSQHTHHLEFCPPKSCPKDVEGVRNELPQVFEVQGLLQWQKRD